MDINRVRWAARRGMLELDLIFEPFIEHVYETLDEADKKRFQDLLVCEDQELFSWFLQGAKPQSDDLIRIIEIVREQIGKHPST